MRPFHSSALAFLLAAPLAASSVACGGSSSGSSPDDGNFGVQKSALSRNTSPNAPEADIAALASDNAAFAFDLYHAVETSQPTGNLFYSPYSISIALAMTYAGANGQTATDMAGTLDWTNLPAPRLHAAFDAIDLELEGLAHSPNASNGGFTLTVADSLWGDKTETFAGPYLDTLATDYGSELRIVDFEHSPDPSRVAINQWVSSETNGKIPTLLNQGTITTDTRFVLANAIYFKASWASQFNPSQTTAQPFTLADGSTVQAPTMTQVSEMSYATTSTYDAVEIPYDGAGTSMVVVQPAAGSFAAVDAGLSGAFFTEVTGALHAANVALSLPKFTITGSTISLKDELSSLGMANEFTPAADFTNMVAGSLGDLYLGDVLHQAFVVVDETGTEAAAATAVIGVGTAVGVMPTPVVIDRPFFFFIRDLATNSVLFVGRVTDPTT
jgi:serpin B